MDKKRRLYRLIEHYINVTKAPIIKEAYGETSKIKIHNISFSTQQKSVLIEAVIVLGDEINEEVLDRSFADYLINDAIPLFFNDVSVKTMIRWDV